MIIHCMYMQCLLTVSGERPVSPVRCRQVCAHAVAPDHAQARPLLVLQWRYDVICCICDTVLKLVYVDPSSSFCHLHLQQRGQRGAPDVLVPKSAPMTYPQSHIYAAASFAVY